MSRLHHIKLHMCANLLGSSASRDRERVFQSVILGYIFREENGPFPELIRR
jgi:hypothetical protein